MKLVAVILAIIAASHADVNHGDQETRFQSSPEASVEENTTTEMSLEDIVAKVFSNPPRIKYYTKDGIPERPDPPGVTNVVFEDPIAYHIARGNGFSSDSESQVSASAPEYQGPHFQDPPEEKVEPESRYSPPHTSFDSFVFPDQIPLHTAHDNGLIAPSETHVSTSAPEIENSGFQSQSKEQIQQNNSGMSLQDIFAKVIGNQTKIKYHTVKDLPEKPDPPGVMAVTFDDPVAYHISHGDGFVSDSEAEDTTSQPASEEVRIQDPSHQQTGQDKSEFGDINNKEVANLTPVKYHTADDNIPEHHDPPGIVSVGFAGPLTYDIAQGEDLVPATQTEETASKCKEYVVEIADPLAAHRSSPPSASLQVAPLHDGNQRGGHFEWFGTYYAANGGYIYK